MKFDKISIGDSLALIDDAPMRKVTLVAGHEADKLFIKARINAPIELNPEYVDGDQVSTPLPANTINTLFDILDIVIENKELIENLEVLLKRTDDLFTGIKQVDSSGIDAGKPRYEFEFHDYITGQSRYKTLDATSPQFSLAVFIGLMAVKSPRSTIFISGTDLNPNRFAHIYNISAVFTYLGRLALMFGHHIVIYTAHMTVLKAFVHTMQGHNEITANVVMVKGNTPDTCNILAEAHADSLLLNSILA